MMGIEELDDDDAVSITTTTTTTTTTTGTRTGSMSELSSAQTTPLLGRGAREASQHQVGGYHRQPRQHRLQRGMSPPSSPSPTHGGAVQRGRRQRHRHSSSPDGQVHRHPHDSGGRNATRSGKSSRRQKQSVREGGNGDSTGTRGDGGHGSNKRRGKSKSRRSHSKGKAKEAEKEEDDDEEDEDYDADVDRMLTVYFQQLQVHGLRLEPDGDAASGDVTLGDPHGARRGSSVSDETLLAETAVEAETHARLNGLRADRGRKLSNPLIARLQIEQTAALVYSTTRASVGDESDGDGSEIHQPQQGGQLDLQDQGHRYEAAIQRSSPDDDLVDDDLTGTTQPTFLPPGTVCIPRGQAPKVGGPLQGGRRASGQQKQAASFIDEEEGKEVTYDDIKQLLQDKESLTPAALASIAGALLLLGCPSEAVDVLRGVLDGDSQTASSLGSREAMGDVYYNLASAYSTLGRHQEAIPLYRAALHIYGEEANASHREKRRQSGESRGRTQAVGIDGVAEHAPEEEHVLLALVNLCAALLYLEDYAEVISTAVPHIVNWETSAESSPLNMAHLAMVYAYLGQAFLMQRNTEEAVGAFQSSLAVCPQASPQLALIHQNMGAALNFAGEYAEAVHHHRQTLQLLDDDRGSDSEKERRAFILDNLGFALGMSGQLEESSRALHDSAELWRQIGYFEKSCESLERLGGLLEYSGRHHDAILEYQSALEHCLHYEGVVASQQKAFRDKGSRKGRVESKHSTLTRSDTTSEGSEDGDDDIDDDDDDDIDVDVDDDDGGDDSESQQGGRSVLDDAERAVLAHVVYDQDAYQEWLEVAAHGLQVKVQRCFDTLLAAELVSKGDLYASGPQGLHDGGREGSDSGGTSRSLTPTTPRGLEYNYSIIRKRSVGDDDDDDDGHDDQGVRPHVSFLTGPDEQHSYGSESSGRSNGDGDGDGDGDGRYHRRHAPATDHYEVPTAHMYERLHPDDTILEPLLPPARPPHTGGPAPHRQRSAQGAPPDVGERDRGADENTYHVLAKGGRLHEGQSRGAHDESSFFDDDGDASLDSGDVFEDTLPEPAPHPALATRHGNGDGRMLAHHKSVHVREGHGEGHHHREGRRRGGKHGATSIVCAVM